MRALITCSRGPVTRTVEQRRQTRPHCAGPRHRQVARHCLAHLWRSPTAPSAYISASRVLGECWIGGERVKVYNAIETKDSIAFFSCGVWKRCPYRSAAGGPCRDADRKRVGRGRGLCLERPATNFCGIRNPPLANVN